MSELIESTKTETTIRSAKERRSGEDYFEVIFSECSAVPCEIVIWSAPRTTPVRESVERKNIPKLIEMLQRVK